MSRCNAGRQARAGKSESGHHALASSRKGGREKALTDMLAEGTSRNQNPARGLITGPRGGLLEVSVPAVRSPLIVETYQQFLLLHLSCPFQL